jgi:phosphomannomutase
MSSAVPLATGAQPPIRRFDASRFTRNAFPAICILMSVFKTYDVRGVYGREIDPILGYRIGRALARHMTAGSFLLGYDARIHSPELYRAVAAGLIDEGKKVSGIGLCSTPQLHYTQINRKADAGIMVTASHNPKEYHGYKVFDSVGGSMSYDKGLSEVEKIVGDIPAPVSVPSRSFPETGSLEEYVKFVAGAAGGVKLSARIVIDASNGSAGRVFKALGERLGIKATVLNAEPDGSFPRHDPNPLKEESKREASMAVASGGADFGVILDGDGDRILFVDEKGQGIENYFLCALIAEGLLEKTPGGAVVYDLISSRVLPERIKEAGGKAVMSRVGYTFVYDKMVESGALFGGETSGHVYFKVTDRYYTESAAYALVVILRLLAARKKPLSALVNPLRGRYVQSPEINVEVADKEAAMARVREAFKGGKLSTLDGLSVEFDDFWFNVRPSNTEPLLRLRLEARSAEVAAARSAEIKKLITG